MTAALAIIPAPVAPLAAIIAPDDLSDFATIANTAHGNARDSAMQFARYAVEAGQALNAAKAIVGHGGWLAWLAENCPDISERTAQIYMRLARELPKLDPANPQRASDLSLRGAIAAISATTNSGHAAKPPGTGNMHWYTPERFVEATRKVLGQIDVDPASCEVAQRVVKAAKYYSEKDEGLAQEWHGDGLAHEWQGTVWLNPPFKDGLIGDFVSKLIAELRADRVSAAIMLVNNSTDTAWFRLAAKAASGICFTEGRIGFYDDDGKISSPAQGQAFFYFGDNAKLFTEVFRKIGMVFAGGPAMDAA